MTNEPYGLIERAAGLLADEHTTIASLSAALGTVAQDHGASVTLTPAGSAFSAITLTRARDSRGLSHVSLTLAAPARLDEFLRRYPGAEEMVGEDDAPLQRVVDLDLPGQTYLVRLFADTHQDTVTGFTLLRDIRL